MKIEKIISLSLIYYTIFLPSYKGGAKAHEVSRALATQPRGREVAYIMFDLLVFFVGCITPIWLSFKSKIEVLRFRTCLQVRNVNSSYFK